MPEVRFPATPTQARFINSKKYMVFFMGPRGEGKTTTGVFATLAHAMRHSADLWPVRWAVIRDTWENLRITTVPSIRSCVQRYGIAAEGIDLQEPKIVRLGMRLGNGVFKPIVEYNFFGLDTPDDANRLQGFEAGGAWIEEPAPAADLSSGVPEECLLSVTSLRQQGIEPRVQITMNPPDETHWTIKYRDDPDAIDELLEGKIDVDFIEIPAGENPGVTEEYRIRNRAILEKMGRFDLIARLVEGKVGFVQLGVAVTPEFGPIHEARASLPIMKSVPILRGWDGGLHPTVTFAQITPLRFVHVFYSVRGDHIGMEQHIEDNVRPWLKDMGLLKYHFRDIGDPSMLDPEKKNSSVSSVTAIEEMLTASPSRAASFEPGPIPIDDRVLPLRALMRRNIRGTAQFQVDPMARAMKRALGGGWHRKKSPAGIVGEIVKDEHSEHGDSLGYITGTEFPLDKLVQRKRPKPRPQRVPVIGAGARQAWMA